MQCSRTPLSTCFALRDQIALCKGPDSTFLVPVFEYLSQVEALWKSKGNISGSDWSTCERRWFERNTVSSNHRDYPIMPEDHEKRRGLIKDSSHFHSVEDAKRQKWAWIYMRNGWEVFRGVCSAPEHGGWNFLERENSNQWEPKTSNAYHQMLFEVIREQESEWGSEKGWTSRTLKEIGYWSNYWKACEEVSFGVVGESSGEN